MSKRKGLSLDEKRTKMLEIFNESKDVFQLKDLEKLAPSAKGITTQSVKDVLQELVDDGLVESEKIGTMVYFWSFPSKTRKELKRSIQELEKKHSEIDKKLKTLEEYVESERGKDSDSEACAKLAKNISELNKRAELLEKELEKHRKNDPKSIKRKIDETKEIIEAANRWTDNIYSLKDWCKKKFSVEEKDLNRNFQISEDLDYLDGT